MATVLTMEQAIASNYTIQIDPLAGFPLHQSTFPEQGIIYFVVIPYRILGFLGLFGIMYLFLVLFTILGAVMAYLLARRITSSALAGLFASLLYAISQIGVYTDSFNRWAGDSFVPIIFMVIVFLFLQFLEEWKANKRKAILLILAILVLMVFCQALWFGGLYVYPAIIFVSITLIFYRYSSNPRIVWGSLLLLLAIAWILLETIPGLNFINWTLTLTFSHLSGQLIEFLGQFEPMAYQTATLYSNFYFSSVWFASGFLTGIFLVLVTMWKYKPENSSQKNAYHVMLALILFGMPFALNDGRFNSILYLPICILGGCSVAGISKKHLKSYCVTVILLLMIVILFASVQILTTAPYIGINSQFKSACLWIANNTPLNSTFLTFSGDGTAVQYWGHRQTYTDTNIEDNQTKINAYYYFLTAEAGNFSYLNEIRPDYFVLQSFPSQINPNNITGTNLKYFALELAKKENAFSSDGVTMTLVYSQNYTLIYKISYS